MIMEYDQIKSLAMLIVYNQRCLDVFMFYEVLISGVTTFCRHNGNRAESNNWLSLKFPKNKLHIRYSNEIW